MRNRSDNSSGRSGSSLIRPLLSSQLIGALALLIGKYARGDLLRGERLEGDAVAETLELADEEAGEGSGCWRRRKKSPPRFS